MTAGSRACWNCRTPAGCAAIACARTARSTQAKLDELRNGVEVDGVKYGPIEATLERDQGANVWILFAIREGKNREVRNVLAHLGLEVNRLIRVSYGPFQLGELAEGEVEEVAAACCAISSASGSRLRPAPISGCRCERNGRAATHAADDAVEEPQPAATGADRRPQGPPRAGRALGARCGANERAKPTARPRREAAERGYHRQARPATPQGSR